MFSAGLALRIDGIMMHRRTMISAAQAFAAGVIAWC